MLLLPEVRRCQRLEDLFDHDIVFRAHSEKWYTKLFCQRLNLQLINLRMIDQVSLRLNQYS